ncbi:MULTISPECIES: acetyl-CoA carboxylase biotin carboxyl carrier protein [Bacillus]|jgi:acetyl-CoA carboxylase biotin carboxyl carrier protein|uniref:Biotin carboxyl carrier protein of acetyl-CoA carboxylase n=3 Tax=Bacillus cereus group TaxID=86661 RepID=A9VGW7_BACMK|nr:MULTISPECIES: acetyl-CoA carboxylase biotin carboxyl carrier protein [Bacillus]EEL04538.1 Acetyl-CoA carboxylase [Bacillus cereus BDRD-ST196]EJQ67324.1 acetyl-CoA carboxylase, biotin carboxyl carrier protein [Bacillus cereus HuA2-4]KXY32721.1 acetyl-CoA carboxylase biotin carboxyl carrier protein subunit [Bacillus cereus]RAN90997.1 acetyl-CoA carboxylase, biotin carboxyl carrier protein [Bacillus sp. SRB_28]ABY45199.1 acetyl-CoA carboxylase, biotin carboxyl carrier protein [Bacillus mycoide
MFKIQEVRELIKLIDSSNIDEFEYKKDGTTIKMKKRGNEVVTVQAPVTKQVVQPAASVEVETAVAAAQVEAPKQEEKKVVQDENLHKITSPMVGTFYSSSSPDTPQYVSVGDRVSKDSIVCIVEAMKLFNEIDADVEGEIVEILVNNGQLVEYGQPLFLVKA